MNQKRDGGERRKSLRTEAEAMVSSLSTAGMTAQPAEILLHELLVHKVELEMQNEELRRAHNSIEEARDRYVDLYEFAPVGYITVNREGLINEINLTGSALLGVDRTKLINRRFSKFVAQQDKDRWHRLFLNMMEQPQDEKQQIGLEMTRGEDSGFYAHLDCQRRKSSDASPVLRVALTDISKIKSAENELRIVATAFESQEGMFITDANSVVLRVNKAFTKITGYSAEEVIGQTPRLFKSGLHETTFYADIWQHINSNGEWHGEIWNRRKNGETYPEWVTITAVPGDDGAVFHYVATLTDITEQKAASEQIEHLAFYDPLTNLPNRRLLKDRLRRALASSVRSKQQGALLFIDLDNFKTLNDTLGHNIGDLLLQQVAQRLLNSIREGDTAARIGGDEFVVMLEGLGENPKDATINAEMTGKKILAALSEPYLLAGNDWRCTSSMGVTLFYDHLATENELLKQVDIAMYQAKQNGRNALCFFDQAMQLVIDQRAVLEADLRLALEKDQFKLYYQMQNTHDGQTVGIEILIRWQHPERGLILPEKFIPLAEETGLILRIGQWVLETACAQLKIWGNQPQAKRLQLAVNISTHQFHQIDFVEQVRKILEKNAIEPNRLKLELTESVVIKDIDDTIAKMLALKAIGVSFSMDDFGASYLSLTSLTQLPLDQIKIDQSFVRNINLTKADVIIVQTIIGMANNLGIEVIAEGVETEGQRVFLEEHGCGLCQGYLFSKPLSLEEFERFWWFAGNVGQDRCSLDG